MKTEIKEIYKCDFCNKLYQVKRFAEKHELMCVKNPENKRACFGCDNLEKKHETIYFDTYCGSGSEVVTLLHCKAKGIFLYPPKVEIKKNMYELGDDSNEPMPRQCDLRKDEEFNF